MQGLELFSFAVGPAAFGADEDFEGVWVGVGLQELGEGGSVVVEVAVGAERVGGRGSGFEIVVEREGRYDFRAVAGHGLGGALLEEWEPFVFGPEFTFGVGRFGFIGGDEDQTSDAEAGGFAKNSAGLDRARASDDEGDGKEGWVGKVQGPVVVEDQVAGGDFAHGGSTAWTHPDAGFEEGSRLCFKDLGEVLTEW